MKKAIAAICCFTLLLSGANLPVSAEDTEPADVDSVVYEQLLKDSQINKNQDDVVTEEELANAASLLLFLDGVTDLSWMDRLQNVTYICLSGGEITDLSVLTQVPHLRNLQLSGVPITDISFTKEMPLETFRLENMPQITLEQRLAAMRCSDVTVQQDFSTEIGALPIGLLDEFYDYYDFSTKIDNDEIAVFEYDDPNPAVGSTYHVIYGKSLGTTDFTVSAKDEVLFSGTVTVTENLTPVQDPPLHGSLTETPEIRESGNRTHHLVKLGTDLYAVGMGEVQLAEQNVQAVGSTYYSEGEESFLSADVLLLTDGSVKVNGTKIISSVKFTGYDHDCFITADGGLYALCYQNGSFVFDKITNDFSAFIDPYASYYYVNRQGELVFTSSKDDADGKRIYTQHPTGIMKPTSGKNDLFVDENSVLWKYDRFGMKATKVAEDVAWVGYHDYDNGSTYGCVHVMKDGTAYVAGTTRQVELYEKPENTAYLESGRLYFNEYYSTSQEMNRLPNYHLTNDHTLCLFMEDRTAAVTNVAAVIGGEYDAQTDSLYVWFLRPDGSFWRYGFRDEQLAEITADAAPTETSDTTEPTQLTDTPIVSGDADGDGVLTITDLILFQKWLLCVPGAEISNGQAVDLNGDGTLDVFDLALMKRALLA